MLIGTHATDNERRERIRNQQREELQRFLQLQAQERPKLALLRKRGRASPPFLGNTRPETQSWGHNDAERLGIGGKKQQHWPPDRRSREQGTKSTAVRYRQSRASNYSRDARSTSSGPDSSSESTIRSYPRRDASRRHRQESRNGRRHTSRRHERHRDGRRHESSRRRHRGSRNDSHYRRSHNSRRRRNATSSTSSGASPKERSYSESSISSSFDDRRSRKRPVTAKAKDSKAGKYHHHGKIQRHDHHRTADSSAYVRGYPPGYNEPQAPDRQQRRMSYAEELAEQVRQKKEQESIQKQKRRHQQPEVYDPWGRGGAGAPLRRWDGRVVADLQKAMVRPDHVSQPILEQRGSCDVQRSLSPQKSGPPGVAQIPDPAAMKKKAQAEYQQFLLQQIAQKEAIKAKEKAELARQEAEELLRIERERVELQQKYQDELVRQKQEEDRIKAENAKLIQEKKNPSPVETPRVDTVEEAYLRAKEKAEETKRKKYAELREKSKAVHRVRASQPEGGVQRPSSPPIPALSGQRPKINLDELGPDALPPGASPSVPKQIITGRNLNNMPGNSPPDEKSDDILPAVPADGSVGAGGRPDSLSKVSQTSLGQCIASNSLLLVPEATNGLYSGWEMNNKAARTNAKSDTVAPKDAGSSQSTSRFSNHKASDYEVANIAMAAGSILDSQKSRDSTMFRAFISMDELDRVTPSDVEDSTLGETATPSYPQSNLTSSNPPRKPAYISKPSINETAREPSPVPGRTDTPNKESVIKRTPSPHNQRRAFKTSKANPSSRNTLAESSMCNDWKLMSLPKIDVSSLMSLPGNPPISPYSEPKPSPRHARAGTEKQEPGEEANLIDLSSPTLGAKARPELPLVLKKRKSSLKDVPKTANAESYLTKERRKSSARSVRRTPLEQGDDSEKLPAATGSRRTSLIKRRRSVSRGQNPADGTESARAAHPTRPGEKHKASRTPVQQRSLLRLWSGKKPHEKDACSEEIVLPKNSWSSAHSQEIASPKRTSPKASRSSPRGGFFKGLSSFRTLSDSVRSRISPEKPPQHPDLPTKPLNTQDGVRPLDFSLPSIFESQQLISHSEPVLDTLNHLESLPPVPDPHQSLPTDLFERFSRLRKDLDREQERIERDFGRISSGGRDQGFRRPAVVKPLARGR